MTLQTDATLYDALHEVASRQPEKIALVYDEEEITFERLIREIDAVAAYLGSLGIERGGRFAAYAQNRPEYLYFFAAAARLGAAFVPVNVNLTPAEVAYVVENSSARYLFHDGRLADVEFPGCTLVLLSEIDLSVADAPIGRSGRPLPTDDLLIVYTSGSTGVPKAVVLDHAGQIAASASFRQLWGLTPDDVTVVPAPFGFLLGLSTSAMISLLSGMTVVINRRFHPAEVLEAFERHRVTVFNGVPTMFTMMLNYVEEQGRRFDLSGMKALVCSGAPLPDELRARWERVFNKPLQNYFGMTECYPLIGRYAGDEREMPRGALGRLAPDAEVRFVGPRSQECEAGVEGEMLARAPSMVKRYHGNEELTVSSFVDGWFRTGDIGYRDEDGYIYLTGRSKDLIIRGGNNVAPTEIESVLMRHEAVRDAAVLGVPDDLMGEVPIAFVVLRAGAVATAEDLRRFAEASMARYKVPAGIFLEAGLPLGSTGKVDKRALRLRYEERG